MSKMVFSKKLRFLFLSFCYVGDREQKKGTMKKRPNKTIKIVFFKVVIQK